MGPGSVVTSQKQPLLSLYTYTKVRITPIDNIYFILTSTSVCIIYACRYTVCTYVWMYVCMHVRMYVGTCTYMYQVHCAYLVYCT